ncbi:unnamed protein product, partial [Laminaria digitata]
MELKTILLNKGLDPKMCTGIAIDNASNMLKAGEIVGADDDNDIVTVSCFCHSLQLTVHRFQGVAAVKGRPKTTAANGGTGAGGAVGAGNAGGGG